METLRRVLVRLWLVLPIAALIGACWALMGLFSNIDRHVSEFGGSRGHFSLSDVSGPGALFSFGEWFGWRGTDGWMIGSLIGHHLALDIVFMLTYGLLFFLIVELCNAPTAVGPERFDRYSRHKRSVLVLLAVELGMDGLENIGLLAGAYLVGNNQVPPWLAVVVAAVTTLKWITLALLVLFAIPFLLVSSVALRWRLERVFTTPRLAVVAIASLIALAELDRLVGETLGTNGQAFTIAKAIGPGALAGTSAWGIWATAPVPPMALLMIHLLLDAVFVVAYGVLLWRVNSGLAWRAGVAVLISLEVTEGVLIGAQIANAPVHPLDTIPFDWVVAAVSTAKWVLVLFLILRAASPPIRAAIRTKLSTAARVFAVHRIAFGLLAVLAVTSLVPQTGVVEQLPDILRAWIKVPAGGSAATLDGRAIADAALAIAWMVITLLVISVMRTEIFARHRGTIRESADRTTYGFWLAAPIGALFFGALFGGIGNTVKEPERYIDPVPFFIFVGVTLALPIGSMIWDSVERRFFPGKTIADRAFPDTSITTIRQAGYVIPAIAVAIVALGMVRSFTAPALLRFVPLDIKDGLAVANHSVADLSTWFVLLGLGFAILAISLPGLFRWLLERNNPGTIARAAIRVRELGASLTPTVPGAQGAPPAGPPRWVVKMRWGIGLTAITAMVLLTVLPLGITAAFGSLVTAYVVLISWGALLSVVETRLQERRPLRLFRALGLQSAPVLTLFIVIPFAVSQFAGPAALHAAQLGTRVDAAVSEHITAVKITQFHRPTLDSAFHRWLGKGGCVAMTDDGQRYRPLVIVAAQGGGIRAATWTVDVLNTFSEGRDHCVGRTVLMSSGASGGSVGLSLFRGADRSAATTETIRGQEALAVGLDGTFISDSFAATTGIRVFSEPGYSDDHGWIWQDRAGLIQASWASRSGTLATPYDFEYQSPTGWLLLNSTAAGAGCRAVISQINLGIGTGSNESEEATPTCGSETPSVSAMIDVQAYCPLDIDWATAAMFSSRFPVVTPAGRLTGGPVKSAWCPALEDLQLADGGYSENSGLGTLSDLAPDLTRIISDYNSRRDPATQPPVIPLALYVRNEGGADVAAPDARPTSELLVPLLANGTKDALISETAWLQRLSDGLRNVCPTAGDQACRDAREAVWDQVGGGVAVAAPSTRPAVIAPLGWTLSDISRNQLLRNADEQRQARGCTSDRDLSFGTLGDLLEAVGRFPESCQEP